MNRRELKRTHDVLRWIEQCEAWLVAARSQDDTRFFRYDAIKEIADCAVNGGAQHFFIFIPRQTIVPIVEADLARHKALLEDMGVEGE